ncbi:flagellar hook-associated protein 3 FlgL [Mariprofundus ferrinatatus]|uniref:Flagellar hook-associated protein 3 FlgL n=1 Tax=Mariprofundus ferrinatatus TaxID=1921087 RepID=A0A2K8L743_9PROT|nr:flagellar hook-associated protein FlgL [Mariprofundus ferrinatatus]ATX82952.1 flagellar hook-associated protein 3 FlgL [Mariprofundus ferrinatatus]
MRITSQTIYDTLMAGIRNQMQTQREGTEQISSGRRFSRPSQDGVAYKTSLDIRHVQSGIDSSLSAIGVAKLRLGVSENALAQFTPIMQRAQVLAVQQANSGLTASERQTAAVEVAALENQLISLANTAFEGKALFAGTATDVQPIQIDGLGNAVYQGNTQDRSVAITPSESIVSNVRADHTAFTQVFSSIKALKDALTGNNVPGIQASIDLLSSATAAMVGLNAEVGGKLNSINLREETLLSMKTQMQIKLNQHESVDIAEVATNLKQSEVSLQAAYAEVSNFNKLSLVNFLR